MSTPSLRIIPHQCITSTDLFSGILELAFFWAIWFILKLGRRCKGPLPRVVIHPAQTLEGMALPLPTVFGSCGGTLCDMLKVPLVSTPTFFKQNLQKLKYCTMFKY